jgi:hypothetical protein
MEGADGGAARPRTAPISVPSPSPSRRGTGEDDLVRNLSFLSGPHVITVQSLRSRAAGDEASCRDAAGPPSCRHAAECLSGGTSSFAGSPAPAGGFAGSPAVVVRPLFEQQQQGGGRSDLEAPLLLPEESAASSAAAKKMRRRIAFAQGLSWGEGALVCACSEPVCGAAASG